MAVDLEIRRDDVRETRLVDRAVPEPDEGQVLLRVESFGLTSNNITYAVFGDAMRYWDFFPVSEAGWGRVPVWGHARVERSRHPEVVEGARSVSRFLCKESALFLVLLGFRGGG